MATRNGFTLEIAMRGSSISSTAGVSGAVATLDQRISRSWEQGTGAGEVDKVFQDDLTVSTSATDLDLAGGSNVKDPASQADQTFTRLHGLVVENRGSVNLTIMGDANSAPIFDAAADSITLAPGQVFTYSAESNTDGVTVTAGTGDIVQLVAASSTTTARVTMWGR